MRRPWKDDNADLEARLRSERPAPDDDLVSRLAAGVPDVEADPRPRPRVRLSLAGGLTGAAIAAAIVVGGVVAPVGPIGDAFEQAASPNANENANKPKPAQSQYEEKVTICHRAKKGEKGNTLTLGAPGAQNHLQNHPADTPGPCPS